MARKRLKPVDKVRKQYTALYLAVKHFEATTGIRICDPDQWLPEERTLFDAIRAVNSVAACRRLLRGMENTADEIASYARILTRSADEVKSRSKTTRLRVLAAKRRK